MKQKRTIFFLVTIIVFCLLLQADNNDVIQCLQDIKSEISDLEMLDQRSDITKKLKIIEEKFKGCEIPESKLVIDIETIFQEIRDKTDRKGNRGLMEQYAEELEYKLNHLINQTIETSQRNTEKANQNIPDKSIEQIGWDTSSISLMVYIILILLIINTCLALFFYFGIFRKEFKGLADATVKIDQSLYSLTKENKSIKQNLDEVEKRILRSFEGKLDELDNLLQERTKDIILLLKDIRKELTEPPAKTPPSPPPSRTRDDKPKPGEQVADKLGDAFDVQDSPQLDKPTAIKINFPKPKELDQQWKNQIASVFYTSEVEIIGFIKTIENKGIVIKWIEDIGKQLVKPSNQQKNAFVQDIFQGIETLRLRLSKTGTIYYEQFKKIFLSPFFNALDLEEFGKKGDPFDPNKHEPIGGSGDGKTVTRVVSSGYIDKYQREIIVKARVDV